jgi:hypothetical protein
MKYNLDISREGKVFWSAFFAVFSGIFLTAYYYVVPAEDAVILYEYAKNLAADGQITYGGSAFPIEGATDFLWMVSIALLKKLGFPEFAGALLLSLAGLSILVSAFRKPTEKLIVVASVLLTPYFYASLVGFSALAFSAAFVVSISLLLRRSDMLYLSVLVLCLIRPDGLVFGAGIVLLRLAGAATAPELRSELAKLAISLIFPGVIYFVWRYWYFGEFLPLPFLVKASGGDSRVFIFYVASAVTVAYALAPVAISLIANIQRKNELAIFAALFVLPMLFYSSVRLEQNVGNRFMAPIFFGSLFLVSRLYGTRALLVLALISGLLQAKVTVAALGYVPLLRQETVYHLSKDLSRVNGRLLTTEAGRLTFYSGWFSEGSWGLNTPRYAKDLISREDVISENYDLVVAHCNLDFLRSDYDLQNDGRRTWDNMCKNIASAIRVSDVEIMLVPFHRPNALLESAAPNVDAGGSETLALEGCKRYDVYAVSRDFPQAQIVLDILSHHGAVKFREDMNTVGDTLCP